MQVLFIKRNKLDFFVFSVNLRIHFNKKVMPKFRILSIDGGGLRGIVPLIILREIEKRTGKRAHELFDMMVGTSTGGLISSCLTIRKSKDSVDPMYSVEDLIKMYSDYAHVIFPTRTAVGKIFSKVTNLWHPEFSDKGIKEVLNKFIGDQKISESLHPIIVPTYDLSSNKPVLFKTSEAKTASNADAKIFDICMATSSAPTYLPAYSFDYKGNKLIAIDGGVYANNPTMAAIAEISKYGDKGFYKKSDGSNVSMEDVSVLSLGTGSYMGSITLENAVRWGQLQWIQVITDIMMKGVSQTTDYEAAELTFNNQYLRLNIKIGEKDYSEMTDSRPQTRDYLIQQTQNQVLNDKTMMEDVDRFCKTGVVS